MNVQTRSEVNGLDFFPTFDQALKASKADPSIWKISFTLIETGERIRLVRHGDGPFYYEPIVLPTEFSAEQIEDIRADVAAGAGHECSEWWKDGKCQLCDRPKPSGEPT